MFWNRKLSNKSLVAIKASLVAFSVVALAISIASFMPASADVSILEHTATVTITPDIANCDELGNTFTVNVKNNGPDDNLLQVDK